MVNKALSIAATGMSAQQLNLDVIANNIANVNTTSYKRARAEFSDLMYSSDRSVGIIDDSSASPVPEGVMVGFGVEATGVRHLHSQGAFVQTDNTYDLLIQGKGYFQIQGPNNEILYTRAGSFTPNENGQLVTQDGNLLIPTVTIDQADVTNVTINKSGEVFIATKSDPSPTSPAFTIELAKFTNEAGLEPVGGNLYRETAASGSAMTGAAGTEGFGKINQGFLEASNVDPVKEITELISAQRAYEMNSKVIQAADEMAAIVSKNLR